jgi:hypothetical protein
MGWRLSSVGGKMRRRALYPGARAGSIRILEDATMADATTAARIRIDKALAVLERRVLELKARPASAAPVTDDDLFAPLGDSPRVQELEAAAREAMAALDRAAAAVREALDEPVPAETEEA